MNRAVTPVSLRRKCWLYSLVALLAGCGGTQGIPVEGQVLLDGQPLATGSITFVPLEAGRSAGAAIQAGQFRLAADDGPQAGRYRVEIVSYAPTGRQISDPDLPGQTIDELAQQIPARYHAESELTAEFTAGQPAKLRYELKSDTP